MTNSERNALIGVGGVIVGAVILSKIRVSLGEGEGDRFFGRDSGSGGDLKDILTDKPSEPGDIEPVITVDSPRLAPPRGSNEELRQAVEAVKRATEEAKPGKPIDLNRPEINRAREPGGSLDLGVKPQRKYETDGLPPQSGGPIDIEAAQREVRNVARHIYNAGGGYKAFKANPQKWAVRAKGRYARRVVSDWQEKAGLHPDGLYGPRTRQAMLTLGAPEPPPALFVIRKR